MQKRQHGYSPFFRASNTRREGHHLLRFICRRCHRTQETRAATAASTKNGSGWAAGGGNAHDFNNLLMVISGFSEVLLECIWPDGQLRGPAREVCSGAGRATSLTGPL